MKNEKIKVLLFALLSHIVYQEATSQIRIETMVVLDNGDTINKTDKNGLKQGWWRSYAGKVLTEEEFYINNKKNGECRYYRQNGSIFSIMKYKDDIIVDTVKTYYKNGNKWSEKVYNNGIEFHITSFYKNGSLKNKAQSVDGYFLCFYQVFYKNGKVKEDVLRVKNEYKWYFYSKKGKIKRECTLDQYPTPLNK